MKIAIIKTGYSFGQCYMPLDQIHKYVINGVIAIADLDNTFSHIPVTKDAKKRGYKVLYGVRLRVSRFENAKHRTGHVYTTFIARTDEGLVELYKLVAKAYDNFYFFPRLNAIDIENLHPGIECLGEDIHENFFPTPQDRGAYEVIAGFSKRNDGYIANFDQRVGPMHIIPVEVGDLPLRCDAHIQQAEMVKWPNKFDMMELCLEAAQHKDLILTPAYMDRLRYEIDMIKNKGYESYFMIVADMINYAKKTMLVGPCRGSSAGSLVCYLMGITEVDPLVHNLIFERFLDVNRNDLPDIDVDFPDRSRERVFAYLVGKYGRENVRALGAVSRYMPKSAIADAATALSIPKYKVVPVQDALIERNSGDERAYMCVKDTFDTTQIGKAFIEEYPAMRIAERIEAHPSHSTKHAAGIIVSSKPLINYAGVNPRDDILMMDKKDAEDVNLLKIDCLGLRTLSVIEDTVRQIPKMKIKDVYDLPLDDPSVYSLFNNMRLTGIFQFEGQALRDITKQMGIHRFEDIAVITSLARPGPLGSGGASRYIKRHVGIEQPIYYNDIHHEITGDTQGIVVYQEQLMEITRRIGGFSWSDVSAFRKAVAKSLGNEALAKYKDQFIAGAKTNGLSDSDSIELWEDMAHSGAYAFNKSHAVSYALVSYWSAYFKANYPLEFAVASLNNAQDDAHAVQFLRDMVRHDGIEYVPVDTKKSGLNWSVIDGKLVGGLKAIVGIADIKANKFIDMRAGKAKPTPHFWKVMADPKTPFDILFPIQHWFGHLYNDPKTYGLPKSPNLIENVSDEGSYLVIGTLIDVDIRDLNSHKYVKERKGELLEGNSLYLSFTIEDDTGILPCTISRWKFEELGAKKIVSESTLDYTVFIVQGTVRGNRRNLYVEAIHNIEEFRNAH